MWNIDDTYPIHGIWTGIDYKGLYSILPNDFVVSNFEPFFLSRCNVHAGTSHVVLTAGRSHLNCPKIISQQCADAGNTSLQQREKYMLATTKVLQLSGQACICSSLASTFHFMGDEKAYPMVMSHINQSLEVDRLHYATKVVCAGASLCYYAKALKNGAFNPFTDTSIFLTPC